MTTRKKQKSKEQIEADGRGPGVAGVNSATVPTSNPSKVDAPSTAATSHEESQEQVKGAETPPTSGMGTASTAVAPAPAGSFSLATSSMTSDAAASAPAFGEDKSMSPTSSNSPATSTTSTTSDAVVSGHSSQESSSNSTMTNTVVTTSTGSTSVAGTTSPTPAVMDADAVAVAYQRVAMAMARMKWSQAAAFLAVLSRPDEQQKVLAEELGIDRSSFTGAISRAREAGVLDGAWGSWTPLLPQLGAASGPPPSGDAVRKRLAERLAVAEAHAYVFRGVKYGSSLEKEVAVALTGARKRFEREVPYSTLIATGRKWTADFVLRFSVEGVAVPVVGEVTGRPDAQESLEEKLRALDGAREAVPYVVVRDQGDVEGLVQTVVEKAKAAAAERAAPASDAAVVPDDQKPRVIGGVYVDPRAVKRPGYVPIPPPMAKREPLPPLPAPPPIPGLELPDYELRRVEELMEEADLRFVQDQIAAARAKARADLAQLRASETPEQKKERAAGLLRDDYATWRAAHGAAAVAERRPLAQERDADAVAAYGPDDGEVELTGEECAEQDELPDDTEAGRSE